MRMLMEVSDAQREHARAEGAAAFFSGASRDSVRYFNAPLLRNNWRYGYDMEAQRAAMIGEDA
jgi:hypothetical protein